MLKKISWVALIGMVACVSSFAKTWTGSVSTSMCGMAHMDNKCVENCVKAGEKYVFVSKGKVLPIQNQDFVDLEKHAGHTVKLTGDICSDGKSVMVTKIEMGSK